jgi:signal recognition particle receptor subunit beta
MGAPVLILGNKQDLDKAMSAEDICKLLNFSNVDVTTSKRSFHIEQISAFTG